MSFSATYINASQFSVEGDQVSKLRIGSVIACVQTPTILNYIAASIHDAELNITIVTVDEATLTDDLTTVLRGPTFVDDVAQESNVSVHTHKAKYQAGYIPAARLDDDDVVDNLLIVGVVGQGNASQLIGANPSGTALEYKTLSGTENEIIVDSDTPGEIVLSLPQPIDATASPEFAGLALTDFNGFLVANASGLIEAFEASAGSQIVRRNAANTGYEVVNFSFMNLKDVLTTGWSDGLLPMWSQSLGKFVPAAVSGGSGEGTTNIYDLFIMQHVMGNGGVQEAVSIEASDVPVSDLIADDMKIDYSASSYTPEDVSSTTDAFRVASHFAGINTALTSLSTPAPDPMAWYPPDFQFNSADHGAIKLFPGKYYKMGYRVGGAYEQTTKDYWEITTATSYNLATCMSSEFGSYPPDGYWYSVFLVLSGGSFAVKFLPLIRVHSVGTSRQCCFATHSDVAITPDNTPDIVPTNDMWNNYRMIGLGRGSRLSNLGLVHTIADSWTHSNPLDTNTPCGVNFSGTETNDMPEEGDWLMLVPPASTACVYVGTVFFVTAALFGGSAAKVILPCNRHKWAYRWLQAYDWNATFSITCDDDIPGLTYLAGESGMPQCPPTAHSLNFSLFVSSGTTEVTGLYASFYNSDSPDAPSPWSQDLAGFSITEDFGTAMTRNVQQSTLWELSGNDVIKGYCSMNDDNVVVAADTAMLVADAYYE